jgi:hypothetical protein
VNTAAKEHTIPTTTTNGAADPSAPSANSLAEILRFDTVPRTKYYSARWKKWVHLRGMDAGQKEEWLAEVVIDGGEGQKARTVSTGLRQNAIARCWVTEDDELIAVGPAGLTALNKLPPESLAELWENVARLNNLRDEDNAALKNSSVGDTGSAASPA